MAFQDRLYDVDLRAHPAMSTEHLLCSLLDQALDVIEIPGQTMDTNLARMLLSSIRTRGTQARGEIRAMFVSREKEVRS